ncbi:aminodeoxychorismate lyase [Microbacterium sp. EYE_5]|uniref:aminodeoxychorismate lyase n=1 Tax=unclassified Microbacterium TaxID=2609290 RepID=UPI002006CAF5|nr:MULTISPECIES: aminodeoxychorismate lyase [unclassified Microbacterium]MCK6081780.1 aminodeoxychorismate lyase [Microbacterium sp. EYE_382]MCK6087050.1 aminodeoxychorismate lyase [Microbacterium sp. EYE_384]MCK6124972.1 aminodeoxychorismate lyase [Microbacterium sp. EYE_80]MCK6127813.1 aminodeoxychorismate lyase [Microbacterium sp. EYE_79]MCK6142734.1 aminodeoxychorismate lyase [Microbacterium sp. EYE_39]
MAWRFALMIDPAASDDARTDFADTFTEVDPSAPALTVGELSTQRGDGIFESIGVVDGHAQEVEPHLERLAHSAEICELPAPHLGQWREAIRRAQAASGEGEAVIKLILSRGVEHGPTPTAWVTVAPASDFTKPRTEGIAVAVLDRGYSIDLPGRAPWLLLGAKTLSYAVNMAAIREAKRRGADDAVFVSSDGFVLEAPTASLIIRRGDTFVTPAPNGGILHGTTQLSLFDHLAEQGVETAYETLPVSALHEADAAWLVSSVRLAAPITAVDGRRIALDAELTASFNRYLLSPRD